MKYNVSFSSPEVPPAARLLGINAIKIAIVVKTTSESFISDSDKKLQTKSAERENYVAYGKYISLKLSLFAVFKSD